jgi:hypothetical protein
MFRIFVRDRVAVHQGEPDGLDWLTERSKRGQLPLFDHDSVLGDGAAVDDWFGVAEEEHAADIAPPSCSSSAGMPALEGRHRARDQAAS